MAATQTSLASSGARGAAFTLAGQAVSVGVKFVGLAVLARLLTPEVFGVMAVATSIQTLAVMVAVMGFPMAIAQAAAITRRAESTLFYLSLAIGVAMALAMALSAPLVASVFGYPELAEIMPWLAPAPILAAVAGTMSMRLARELRFVAVAAVEAAAAVVALGTAIVLATRGLEYPALVAQALLTPFIQAVGGALVARWLPGRIGRPGEEERQLIRVGLDIFGINALRQATRYVVAPALSLVTTPTQVGLFDRAQQLVVLPLTLTIDQMRRVTLPVLSRVQDDAAMLAAYYRRAQQLTTYGTATLLVVMAALAEPLVRIVFGPGWEGAVPLLQILALGGVVRAFGLTVQWLHMGGGATRAGMRFNAWAMPLQVAITLVGLPWGATGVAVANGIGWLVYWPLAVHSGARSVGVPAAPIMMDALRAFASLALPVGLASAGATMLVDRTWAMLAAGLASGAVVGAIAVAALPWLRRDLRRMASLLRR